MEKVRLGIIGVGGMGSSHVRYLNEGEVDRCELTAVCDIDPEKVEKFDDLKTYTDSAELIRSGNADAVIIATPHYDHTTIGIDALENGLHILVEKPLSVHKCDCERLIAAHEANKNLIFCAMFQMRTNPAWKCIKKLIDDGELGEIRRTNWIVTSWFRTQAYYDSGGWRATWEGEGGGVLMNQCPHNIDLFQWLCGMPVRVQAHCALGKYHNIETEDDVTVYVEYENGATGLFVTSTGEAPGTDRLEIVGDRGRLVYENDELLFRRNTVSASEFITTAKGGFDRPEVWDCKIPIPSVKTGHSVITQNFIEAILDGKSLIAPAEEGVRSVELANAMQYSSWTNKTVDIPLDGAAFESKLKQLIEDSTFKKGNVKAHKSDIGASFR